MTIEAFVLEKRRMKQLLSMTLDHFLAFLVRADATLGHGPERLNLLLTVLDHLPDIMNRGFWVIDRVMLCSARVNAQSRLILL